MKKLVIILVLINVVFNCLAQKSYKDEVYLLPLNDNTTIAINGEKRTLGTMFFCNQTAKIEILTGKISIMTTGGEEVSVNAGTSFHVKYSQSSKKSIPLGKVSKYLNSPSTYLPNLYSDNRSEFKVFPLES